MTNTIKVKSNNRSAMCLTLMVSGDILYRHLNITTNFLAHRYMLLPKSKGSGSSKTLPVLKGLDYDC